MSSSLKDTYISACAEQRCKPNSGLLKKLARSKDDQKLILSDNYCGSEKGFRALLVVVRAHDKLKHLDLSGNYLTSENIRDLVETLIKHPTCSSIYLNDNRLYIDAGKDLVRLARLNPKILEISVDDRIRTNSNKIPTKLLAQLQREVAANVESSKNAK